MSICGITFYTVMAILLAVWLIGALCCYRRYGVWGQSFIESLKWPWNDPPWR